MTKSQQQFVNWVKQNDPFVYNVAKARFKIKRGGGLNGVGETTPSTGFFSELVNTVKNVIPAVISYKQQKKVMDLQIERAKNNQPPIDVAQFSPVMRIDASLTPEGEASANRIAINTVKQSIGDLKPYFFGGLALAAFLLFKNRR